MTRAILIAEECPERKDIKSDGTLDTAFVLKACADTDGDGVADIFDVVPHMVTNASSHPPAWAKIATKVVSYITSVDSLRTKIPKVIAAAKGNWEPLRKRTTAKLGIKMQKTTALAISIAMDVGPFLYAWASGQINPNSLAFTQALAQTYATVVADVLVFAISINPVGAR